jgi:hypothetical protein
MCKNKFYPSAVVFLLASLLILPGCSRPQAARWWKGNIHTHTLWSDGRHYPEMVVEWYKKRGYNFLALSDHNILSQGQKWIDATNNRGGETAFQKYLERFGTDWVEQKTVDDRVQVRLKPLSEFRSLFEEPGKFLLIQAEEITPKDGHVNATNLREVILPQDGNTVAEIVQNNINAVAEQSERTGQPMLAHIPHVNFRWLLTAEEIMKMENASFFEVYNSGLAVIGDRGDKYHASTERMWDIILTKRLAELQMPVMYGSAADDAHDYHRFGQEFANPGRGWVVVRSHYLTPESLIKAMEAGDFYCSTGVVLKDIQFDGKTLKIIIKPENGISYTTEFIGTLKGYDPTVRPMVDANGVPMHATGIYSNDIGKVLAMVKGTIASYSLTGDEIYVRAKITSTKPKQYLSAIGDVEVAWTEPVQPSGNP